MLVKVIFFFFKENYFDSTSSYSAIYSRLYESTPNYILRAEEQKKKKLPRISALSTTTRPTTTTSYEGCVREYFNPHPKTKKKQAFLRVRNCSCAVFVNLSPRPLHRSSPQSPPTRNPPPTQAALQSRNLTLVYIRAYFFTRRFLLAPLPHPFRPLLLLLAFFFLPPSLLPAFPR